MAEPQKLRLSQDSLLSSPGGDATYPHSPSPQAQVGRPDQAAYSCVSAADHVQLAGVAMQPAYSAVIGMGRCSTA